VTKPELGTKRICSNCNLKFYDLHNRPIVCPTCKTVFELSAPISAKPRRLPDVSTAPVQKPAIASALTEVNSSENADVLTKDKNGEDGYIDEDFEKE
jgi:uncharacterized protein (TIGR02300 family)